MCVDQTSLHPPPCWSLPQGWNTLPRSCSGGGLLQIRRTPALWSEEPSEVKWKLLSHVRLSATPQTIQSMEFSRPEYWSGLAFPFSRRSSQPRDCLPHCRRILYQLSHQGSPRILEWVAYPLSRGSSWPRNQTGVACIASGFLTSWVTREVTQSVFYSLPIKNSFYILFIYLLLATPCCQVCGIEPLPPDMEGWSCNHWTAREALGFTFLSCLKFKKEYVTETICGPQNLKCLLSDQLQKKFANPCSKAQGPG